MLTPALVLLVTAVTMTQADQMSDLLHLPPHKDHIYLFEVFSEASVPSLKAALSNFTIRGSYKIIGENRFFFEIISNDTAKLRALKFPAGSTTAQYTVEHFKEYMEMFGVENNPVTEDSLPDTVLGFSFWEKKLPETICSKTFEMEMRDYLNKLKSILGITKVRSRVYPVLASYPPKMIFFSRIEDNMVQNFANYVITRLGGYGQNKFTYLHVVKI